MANLILGEHPESVTVRLVRGDGAVLVATLTDSTGTAVDWPAAPTLQFANSLRAVISEHVATIAASTATWTLTREEVDTIWSGSIRWGSTATTNVRALLPAANDADGTVEYAGAVQWSDGWTAGASTQAVTFTTAGGPAGPRGRGVESITDTDGDGVATITYSDGTTQDLPLPAGVGGGIPAAQVDHGLVADTLTIDAAGSHELDLTGPLAVTVTTTGDVTLWAHGTGTLTVADKTITVDGDAVVMVVTSVRGVQTAYQVGVGGGPTTDTTPPPPVTDLTATGGEAQVALSWSAVTDPDSPVSYRYRVWITSGGASGEWTDTTDTTATVTGLPAGGYTAEVYSYSSGGATVADTATATVTAPAGWSPRANESFTYPDGTALTAITTDGHAWESSDSPAITAQSGKAAFATHATQSRALLVLNETAPVAGMRVTGDYDVSADTSGNLGAGLILTSAVNGQPYYDALEAEMVGAVLSLRTYQGVIATIGGQPMSGTMQLEIVGDQATVRINGTQVLTGTMPRPVDGRAAGLHLTGYSTYPATVDNLSVERLT